MTAGAVREPNTFSASVTLDGLVVLNQMASRPTKEATNKGINGKEQNGFKGKNGHHNHHTALMNNGYQLYRVHGVKQNNGANGHHNIRYQRNITSQWQEHARNNSSGSTQSSSSSAALRRSAAQTPQTISQAPRGRSTKAPMNIRELPSPRTKPKASSRIKSTAQQSGQRSTTAQQSGQESPVLRNHETVRNQAKADPKPPTELPVKRSDPTTNAVPTKSNSQQSGQRSPVLQNEVIRNQVKADPNPTTTLPVKRSEPTIDTVPTESNSQQSGQRSPVGNEFKADPKPTTELPVKRSEPTTDTVPTESNSQQNRPAVVGDSASRLPSAASIVPSTATPRSSNTSHHQPKSSEHTRRAGNRSNNMFRMNSFASPLRMKNMLVVNKMHSDDSESSMDDLVQSCQSVEDLRIPPRRESNGMSLNEKGSQRSLNCLGTTPIIPEGGVIKPDDNFNSSFKSANSTSSRISAAASKRTMDSRITSNRRNTLQHTREVHSFYEPTIALKDKKRFARPAETQIDALDGGKLPKPYRFKSRKQKAKEKRKKERKEARRRAIKARRYARPEDYQPLTESFPVLTHSQDLYFHSEGLLGVERTEVMVTTADDKRDLVATLSYTELKPSDKAHKLASGRRVLRDAAGNQCALIMHSRNIAGASTFKICGPVPMSSHHKSVDGYFVWAEVKNVGEISPQFCMTIKKDADPQGQSVRFKTKAVGSTFLSSFFGAHGFSIYRKKEDGTKTGGCGNISYYSGCRGLTLSANLDFGLMLCFALVVDEMVANRLR
mmetsp:Transcript_35568/g.86179  ORF Transcript_35568/g.86179 Transcript_35568/m.86179 type:complete len:777 (-) Transcript_35568:440-2770(-)|eukprot:CAMPEP_0113632404 /NCGR_PEP_ID=MMETSP0017_2-20120614/16842_1 /TAXON_ID=2856 /ORGANISM="Cylindrotheca closterium" /LENGTH=776 /DNA_ID=CAMNT_0000542957 /DNA_START=96 /DNA_END=2426 /DNA_ORIENTATION=+ /assembly_acc=CAM_ASM_000147